MSQTIDLQPKSTLEEFISSNPFSSDKHSPEHNVEDLLQKRFVDQSSHNSSNHIFSVTRSIARLLLHEFKHTLPHKRNDFKTIRYCKRMFDNNLGLKNSWPKNPIRINMSTKTIDKGVCRLYALACSNKYAGAMFEIEIVFEENSYDNQ